MSGTPKDGRDDDLAGSAFDFENEIPSDGDPVNFEFDTMPEPGADIAPPPPASRAAPATAARFADDDLEDDADAMPTRAPGAGRPSTAKAAPVEPVGDFGDFEGVDEEPRVAPRRTAEALPAARKAEPAFDEPEGDDELGFTEEPAPLRTRAARNEEPEDGDEQQAYQQQEGEELEEEVDEAPARQRKNILSYAPHIGGAVMVLVIGLVGMNYVAPMFIGGSSSETNQSPIASLPTDMGRPADLGVPAPKLPSLPNTLPATLPSDQAPKPTGFGSSPINLPSAQPVPVEVRIGGGAPTLKPGAPVEATSLPIGRPALDASPDVERRLAALERNPSSNNEVDQLKSELSRLKQRMASLEARAGDAAPRPAVEPPSKPQVVDNWFLSGVGGGVAWVKGPKGPSDFHEVREGTDLPGVGLVKAVTKYEKKWVVITTAGVILEK